MDAKKQVADAPERDGWEARAREARDRLKARGIEPTDPKEKEMIEGL